MKLNLGAGNDRREGYYNIDLNAELPQERVDLTEFPWKWETNSCSEILMLDLLEHFPYRLTDLVLKEVYRVLRVGGCVDIQVPDFEHCALAALDMHQYLCNFCGARGKDYSINAQGVKVCQCGKTRYDIAEAAIMRLYGGQDFEGNWHFNAFTKETLVERLKNIGFGEFELLEKHHQFKNWNFKLKAVKVDVW